MYVRCLIVALVASLGVSCGGGGGGGGGSVPPPSNSAGGSFTLASNTATFNARTDQSGVLETSIALTVNDTRNVAAIGAAYVAPNQPAPWLFVDISGGGSSYSVNLDAFWTGMAPGTYSAVISIGTAKANGDILQRRDITVTLIITEITVRAEFGPFGFTTTFGHDDVSRAFSVHVDAPAGRSWTASSSVPWIQVPATVFTGPADVPVVATAAGLGVNVHSGQLRFESQANAADNTTRAVSLNVVEPPLILFRSQLTLGGEDGSGTLSGSVVARLETGSNTYPLALTAATTTGGNWLGASGPANIRGSDVTLTMSAAAAAAAGVPGRYDGAVQVQANVLGRLITRTLPVRYNQDQNKLVAATLGVAFSHLPTRSVLRRAVRIHDSQGRNGVPWTATDDAPWLTVTGSGMTGGDLTLLANPAGLAANQIHHATVTVGSSSATVDNQQVIRVALKVGTTDPVTISHSQTAYSVVANPVLPWVYAMLPGGDVEVRDVHTGGLLDTFQDVTGGEGTALAISDDGLTLFAIDGWVTQRVRVLDAQTGALLGNMPMQRQYTSTLHFMRPNAHPVLISGHGEVFDVDTRTAVEGFNISTYYPSNKFAHSGDQRFLFSQQRASHPSQMVKARIAWSTLVTPQLVTEYLLSSQSGEGTGDVCVSVDNSRVMTGNRQFATPFNLLNSSDLSVAQRLPAQTYAMSNVACLWNGLYMGTTGRDPPANLFFFDAQGNGIASFLLYQVDHEPASDRVIVSGDASRVIAVTGGPSFHTSFYDAPLVP